jgi:GGDEF domain-containing protein
VAGGDHVSPEVLEQAATLTTEAVAVVHLERHRRGRVAWSNASASRLGIVAGADLVRLAAPAHADLLGGALTDLASGEIEVAVSTESVTGRRWWVDLVLARSDDLACHAVARVVEEADQVGTALGIDEQEAERLLVDRVDRALQRLARDPGVVVLVAVDADLTAQTAADGDPVRAAFSGAIQRLDGLVRGSDSVLRIRGHQLVLLAEMNSVAAGEQLSARVRRAMEAAFPMAGTSLRLVSGVGLVVAASADADAVTLLDQALDRARADRVAPAVEALVESLPTVVPADAAPGLLPGVGLVWEPVMGLGHGALGGLVAQTWLLDARRQPTSRLRLTSPRLALERDSFALAHLREHLRALGSVRLPLGVTVDLSTAGLANRAVVDEVAALLSSAPAVPVTVRVGADALLGAGGGQRRHLLAVRELGCLVAVETTGAATAGLREVLDLAPAAVHLHPWVSEDESRVGTGLRRAMVAACEATGTALVAGGLTSARQVDRMVDEGVRWGSGPRWPVTAAVVEAERVIS